MLGLGLTCRGTPGGTPEPFEPYAPFDDIVDNTPDGAEYTGFFSVRQVDGGSGANLIRVYRESDAQQRTFTATVFFRGMYWVDATEVEDWLSGSIGRIARWYNQNGTARHLDEGTLADMPYCTWQDGKALRASNNGMLCFQNMPPWDGGVEAQSNRQLLGDYLKRVGPEDGSTIVWMVARMLGTDGGGHMFDMDGAVEIDSTSAPVDAWVTDRMAELAVEIGTGGQSGSKVGKRQAAILAVARDSGVHAAGTDRLRINEGSEATGASVNIDPRFASVRVGGNFGNQFDASGEWQEVLWTQTVEEDFGATLANDIHAAQRATFNIPETVATKAEKDSIDFDGTFHLEATTHYGNYINGVESIYHIIFKADSLAGPMCLFSKLDENNFGFEVILRPDGSIRYERRRDVGGQIAAVESNPATVQILTGQWYTLSIRSSSTPIKTDCHLNGQPVKTNNTDTIPGNQQVAQTINGKLSVGKRLVGSALPFDGKITSLALGFGSYDEDHIWNNGQTVPCLRWRTDGFADMFAWWRFGDEMRNQSNYTSFYSDMGAASYDAMHLVGAPDLRAVIVEDSP